MQHNPKLQALQNKIRKSEQATQKALKRIEKLEKENAKAAQPKITREPVAIKSEVKTTMVNRPVGRGISGGGASIAAFETLAEALKRKAGER